MKREELLKHAGKMVLVYYGGGDYFIIGWFFCLDTHLHLKITSTKFETYESRTVDAASVTDIQEYEMN